MHILRLIVSSCIMLTGLTLLSACASTAPETPSAVQTLQSGQIIEISIPAPSLAGNLLGDPDKQPASIYLPPSYETSPDRRYPVLYLLHGFTGTHQTWMIAPDAPDVASLSNGDYQRQELLSKAMLDRKFSSEGLTEMIIVAPNSRNTNKHSFYVNSPVTGNWEDYIAKDVVEYMDANYRTIPARESRGIAGHSGGGNGAMLLGMHHPDTFGSIYAMAPCCLGAMYSLPSFLSEETGELSELWQTVYTRLATLKSVDELPIVFTPDMSNFYTNVEFAAAPVYAPNLDRPPFYADHLYELKDGELVRNQSAIDRRLAQSAYHKIEKHAEDLKSMRGIFIDYGEREWSELSQGNREFSEALARHRIPFQMEIYAKGDHGNLIHKRMETHGLAFFAETLAAEPE